MKKYFLKFSRITLFLLQILLFNSTVFSQNNFGTMNSNYSPSNMVKLNPASMINAKTYLDINLAGGGAFINNNLVNYSNTSVIGLIKDRSLPLFYSRIVQNQGIPIQIFAKGFVSGLTLLLK